MAVTQADIDALNAAIAAPERQVSDGDKSVTYQTVDSLIKARNDMVRQLARQDAAAARRSKVTTIIHGGRDF